ncbi:HDOD domain-containing protein [Thalassotalea ganghwensis]
MLIFENNHNINEIYHRALSLMISKEFAELQSGKITLSARQHSEQQHSRRELLEIEQQAQQEKIIEQHGKSHFKQQVMAKFNQQVLAKVNNLFDNKERLFVNELRVENATTNILEVLAVKAASINKINAHVDSLPWLTNELINLVNKPQYRKRADVQVADAHLALSYIGLENLKQVIPTFVLKHWLPTTTSPFSLLKRKLWNNALSIGLTAKVLAKESQLNEFNAFSAGLFSNIGHFIISRGVITTYNDSLKAEIKEAYDTRDKRLHDILLEFSMSPDLLLEQLTNRSTQLSADIVELMRLDRLAITEPLFDLAIMDDIAQMHPIAQLVAKATAYVMFRSLAKEELISSQEAKLLLGSVKLQPNDISLLKRSDIDHIKLNFE